MDQIRKAAKDARLGIRLSRKFSSTVPNLFGMTVPNVITTLTSPNLDNIITRGLENKYPLPSVGNTTGKAKESDKNHMVEPIWDTLPIKKADGIVKKETPNDKENRSQTLQEEQRKNSRHRFSIEEFKILHFTGVETRGFKNEQIAKKIDEFQMAELARGPLRMIKAGNIVKKDIPPPQKEKQERNRSRLFSIDDFKVFHFTREEKIATNTEKFLMAELARRPLHIKKENSIVKKESDEEIRKQKLQKEQQDNLHRLFLIEKFKVFYLNSEEARRLKKDQEETRVTKAEEKGQKNDSRRNSHSKIMEDNLKKDDEEPRKQTLQREHQEKCQHKLLPIEEFKMSSFSLEGFKNDQEERSAAKTEEKVQMDNSKKNACSIKVKDIVNKELKLLMEQVSVDQGIMKQTHQTKHSKKNRVKRRKNNRVHRPIPTMPTEKLKDPSLKPKQRKQEENRNRLLPTEKVEVSPFSQIVRYWFVLIFIVLAYCFGWMF